MGTGDACEHARAEAGFGRRRRRSAQTAAGAHLSKSVGGPAEWAEQLDRLGLEVVPKAAAV